MPNNKNHFKYFALLIGLVSMTFAGVNWRIALFAWIAPLCLLYFTRNAKKKEFALLFLGFCVVGYVSQTCNNLMNEPVVGIINGLSFALIFTITYLLDSVLYIKGKGFFTSLIFPALFVLIEFVVSSVIGTSGIVAQTQFYFKPLVQFSSYFGLFTISFLVVWFGAVVNWIIENNFKREVIEKSALIYFGVFALIMVLGLIKNKPLTDKMQAVKVATISSNKYLHANFALEADNLLKNGQNKAFKIPQRFFANKQQISDQIAKTIEAAEAGAKIIVWNEIALILNPAQVDSLAKEIIHVAKLYKVYVLMAYLEQEIGDKPKLFNNKSIFVNKQGEVVWQYMKAHIAPAEIPFVNAGNSKIPFYDTEYGRLGNVICYDLDFPIYLQQAAKNNIDMMLVPAYDWKNYEELHSNMAQLEAMQNGYALIRANGSGINLVTNSNGQKMAEMNTFKSQSSIMYANLQLNKTITLYSKIGNSFIVPVALFLLFIIYLRLKLRDKAVS